MTPPQGAAASGYVMTAGQKAARLVGGAISLAAVYYFLHRLLFRTGLSGLALSSGPVLWAVGLGLATYCAAFLPLIGAWHRALSDFGGPGRLRVSTRVLLISQFAKYIPGNVGQYVGRFALGRAAGYPSAAILSALMFETVGVTSIGVTIGCVIAFNSAKQLFATREVILVLVSAAVALPIALWVLDRIRRRNPRLTFVKIPTWRTVVLCACSYGLGFVFLTLIVMILANQAYGAPAVAPWTVLGVVTWGWLAGYLTPGAPAGMGVREVALLTGLTGIYGETTALGVVLLLRLVTTVGDGLALGVGLLLRWSGHRT